MPSILAELSNYGATSAFQKKALAQFAKNPISPARWTQLAKELGKENAKTAKTTEGQTSQLPGAGGTMTNTPTMNPGTPTQNGVPLNFTFNAGGPVALPSGFGGNAFDVGGAVGTFGNAGGCDFLPSPLKELCKGAVVLTQKPSTGGSTTGSGAVVPAACPPGTVKVGNTCVSPGDVFPGGAPFLTEAGGQAVVGAFGLPALSPSIVGSVAGRNGVSPIRRCPRGMVLGFDELCYPKAVLPRRSRFRKHKGAARPPMTAADASALRRIGSLKKRVKDLASDAGLTCSTRGTRRK